jgi:hypothetical protein
MCRSNTAWVGAPKPKTAKAENKAKLRPAISRLTAL